MATKISLKRKRIIRFWRTKNCVFPDFIVKRTAAHIYQDASSNGYDGATTDGTVLSVYFAPVEKIAKSEPLPCGPQHAHASQCSTLLPAITGWPQPRSIFHPRGAPATGTAAAALRQIPPPVPIAVLFRRSFSEDSQPRSPLPHARESSAPGR